MKSYTRKKLSAVCSYDAYIWLSNWIMAQYPTNPYPPAPEDYFYKNKTHREYLSRFIESVMVNILTADGYDPIKAQDKGRRIDKSKIVTNVTGQRRKIGSAVYIKDKNVRVGRADVKCFARGRMLNLEVKVGADRMSDDQKAEQLRCEKMGEEYHVIKTIDDFLAIYIHSKR